MPKAQSFSAGRNRAHDKGKGSPGGSPSNSFTVQRGQASGKPKPPSFTGGSRRGK